MWPFKRRQEPQEVSAPMPCQHKWKDFPWYLEETTIRINGNIRYRYNITQPYVCVKCKARRDEILEGYTYTSGSQRDNDVAKARSEYKNYLKPKAIVEDMVVDEQLVDREYLRLIDEFQNPSSPFDHLDLLKAELEKVKAAAAAERGVPYEL